MKTALFRKEVLEEKRSQWLGPVIMAPRLSHRIYTWLAAMTIVGVLAILCFGEYTRTARIDGWLVPDQGLVQIFASGGEITAVHVEEGQEVQKGMPLVTLSTETQTRRLGATQTEVSRQLVSRRDSLSIERQQIQTLNEQRQQMLSAQIETGRAEEEYLTAAIQVQRELVVLAERAEARGMALRQSGDLSDADVDKFARDRLSHQANVFSLQQTRSERVLEHRTNLDEMQRLPIESALQLAAVDRQIAALNQEIAETEALREAVLIAPESGTVTAVQAVQGSRPPSDLPLLSILPTGSTLDAQLFCDSGSIGFLHAGQRVRMRFEAFPYQRFGHQSGVVKNISRSSINPSEMPRQLAGLTSLVSSDRPVYRVTVQLDRQFVLAYGEQVALQPGMQLDADVMLDRRKVVAWMLEPLYSVTGKLRE